MVRRSAPPTSERRRVIRYDNVFEVVMKLLITGLIAFLYLPLVPL